MYKKKNICDKYNEEGCQKSLSHPSWPPIVIYDITNDGEDRTKKTEHKEHKSVLSSLHSPYSMHQHHATL